jgi:hypothetical protein
MQALCHERGVRMFPPIPRRQSYTSLSIAGHDYIPAAEAIEHLVLAEHSKQALHGQ